MEELTIQRMSETDGGIGFRGGFFDGLLCGASITGLAVLAFAGGPVVGLAAVVARRVLIAGALTSCAHAFFI